MREEKMALKRGDSKIGLGAKGVSPKPSPKPSPLTSPATSPTRKMSAANSAVQSAEKKSQLAGSIQRKESSIGKGLKT